MVLREQPVRRVLGKCLTDRCILIQDAVLDKEPSLPTMKFSLEDEASGSAGVPDSSVAGNQNPPTSSSAIDTLLDATANKVPPVPPPVELPSKAAPARNGSPATPSFAGTDPQPSKATTKVSHNVCILLL